MGLNLHIRRIVFESLEKYNGQEVVPVSPMQVWRRACVYVCMFVCVYVFVSEVNSHVQLWCPHFCHGRLTGCVVAGEANCWPCWAVQKPLSQR